MNLLQKMKNPLVLLCIMLDALFFVFWGLITTPSRNTIIRIAQQIIQESGIGLGSVFKNPLFLQLIMQFSIFAILSFCLYILFHGTNWWLAKKIMMEKEKYTEYVVGFIKTNIVWGLLIGLNHIIHLGLSIYQKMQETLAIHYGQAFYGIGTITMNFVLWITIILALLTYPKNEFRTIKIGFRKILSYGLTVFVLFQATMLIPRPLFSINTTIAYILGFMLVFPTLTFIRLYTIKVANDTT